MELFSHSKSIISFIVADVVFATTKQRNNAKDNMTSSLTYQTIQTENLTGITFRIICLGKIWIIHNSIQCGYAKKQIWAERSFNCFFNFFICCICINIMNMLFSHGFSIAHTNTGQFAGRQKVDTMCWSLFEIGNDDVDRSS